MSNEILKNDVVKRAVHALALSGARIHGVDPADDKTLQAIGRDLYELNNRAVNTLNGTRRRVPPYDHGPLDPSTPAISLYKALVHVITNCDAPKTRDAWFFKELHKAKAKLAVWIVENSREYEAASVL